MTSFSDLGLAESLLRALRTQNYTIPTPIQAQAIPILMQGADLLGIAQTGTGKTAAFALPLLHRLQENRVFAAPRCAQVLVLAPTRELAVQIAESFRNYGKYIGASVACIVGGVSFGPQIKAMSRGVDVLVATPGRLLDHMQSGHVKLDQTHYVVLDEADHMLDLGFVLPVRKIMSKLPRTRQTLLFSATMPKEIAALADEFLHKPQRVSVTPVATTAERVGQQVIMVDAGAKGSILADMLKDPEFARTIVFTRTKRGADRVSKSLDQAGIPSAAIHGNKSQNQRQAALDSFKSGRTRVLVATDIAARGIDVSGVSHVVNFELPDVPESYVHRIGRTARAGKEGQAISLVENAERHLLRQIERLTRQEIPTEDKRSDAERDKVGPPPGAKRQQRGGRPHAGKPGGHGHKNGHGARPQGEPRRHEGSGASRSVHAARPADAQAQKRRRFRGPRPQHAGAGA
ncbi:MAG: DEAD/DEAH box helicase [Beijerinckiaceae bacterium]